MAVLGLRFHVAEWLVAPFRRDCRFQPVPGRFLIPGAALFCLSISNHLPHSNASFIRRVLLLSKYFTQQFYFITKNARGKQESYAIYKDMLLKRYVLADERFNDVGAVGKEHLRPCLLPEKSEGLLAIIQKIVSVVVF
jgi:hypothetical protein